MHSEEELVARFLDAADREWLAAEHKRLAEAGFPEEEVRRHSQEEEALFKERMVPAAIRTQIHEDHQFWERGELLSRAEGGT